MPKVNIYLPDELLKEARKQELPLSKIAQEAIAAKLAVERNKEWIERRRRRPIRERTFDTSELMAEVRDEFGT